MVLADYDLFTNTFTKRKMSKEVIPTVVTTGLTCLLRVFFCQQLAERVHYGRSFLSTNIYQLTQVTLPKEKKPTALDTGWITGKTENCFKEGNNTMQCFVLVCDVHSIRTAGGAGRNTGFRVQSCCSWKTETHVMAKKKKLWDSVLYVRRFSDMLVSERKQFHWATEYNFYTIYTVLLQSFL